MMSPCKGCEDRIAELEERMLKIEVKNHECMVEASGNLPEMMGEMNIAVMAFSENVEELMPGARECFREVLIKNLMDDKIWRMKPDKVQVVHEVDRPEDLFDN